VLSSLSTRGFVGAGDNVMIAGFIVDGGPLNVLIKAQGPSLAPLGISGALNDPSIQLIDANGTLVESNDNWQNGNSGALIAASGRAPTDAKESAIMRTLQPGVYTVVTRGVADTQGVVLVSVSALN